GARHCRVHLFLYRDIGNCCAGLAAGGGDLVHHGLCSLGEQVVDSDFRSLCCEIQGHTAPHALTGPCYECHLVRQMQIHGCFLFVATITTRSIRRENSVCASPRTPASPPCGLRWLSP